MLKSQVQSSLSPFPEEVGVVCVLRKECQKQALSSRPSAPSVSPVTCPVLPSRRLHVPEGHPKLRVHRQSLNHWGGGVGVGVEEPSALQRDGAFVLNFVVCALKGTVTVWLVESG